MQVRLRTKYSTLHSSNHLRCPRLQSSHQSGYTPVCATSSSEVASKETAEEGDNVSLHFTVFGEQNEKLESTKEAGQPLAFEVGSSAIIDNELLAAFDAGIRGLSRGDLSHALLPASRNGCPFNGQCPNSINRPSRSLHTGLPSEETCLELGLLLSMH